MKLQSLPDGKREQVIQQSVDNIMDGIKKLETKGGESSELAEEILDGIQDRTELVEDFMDLHDLAEELLGRAKSLNMQPLVTALLAMGVLTRQGLINVHPIYWREDLMMFPSEGEKKDE